MNRSLAIRQVALSLDALQGTFGARRSRDRGECAGDSVRVVRRGHGARHVRQVHRAALSDGCDHGGFRAAACGRAVVPMGSR